MSREPRVTVVVPAWNTSSVLAEALDSIRAQTFRDFEVLVVDDGSTDDTARVAERYSAEDRRFRLICRTHAGVSSARNAALAEARGEWIAFLDADDVWLPPKLDRQLALLEQDPAADLLFTNFLLWDGNRDLGVAYPPGTVLPEGNPVQALIRACQFLMSTVLVQRELLLEIGGFDTALLLSQDWDLYLRLVERGIHARGLAEPLARYRRWPGSRTMNNLLSMANNARVIAARIRNTPRHDLRPLYQRRLKALLADQELILAAQELRLAAQRIDDSPREVPVHVWRAWRHHHCWRWMKWLLRLVWPDLLGGRITKAKTYAKLKTRYPASPTGDTSSASWLL
jgi:glycosyltransferase involved in cell wall biosynthesis